jgi:hypothetical protein
MDVELFLLCFYVKEEYRFCVFKERVLKRIFGRKKDEVQKTVQFVIFTKYYYYSSCSTTALSVWP